VCEKLAIRKRQEGAFAGVLALPEIRTGGNGGKRRKAYMK
jgi:hypothetical protein